MYLATLFTGNLGLNPGQIQKHIAIFITIM